MWKADLDFIHLPENLPCTSETYSSPKEIIAVLKI